jgi:Protein of unknown function (DUF3107)
MATAAKKNSSHTEVKIGISDSTHELTLECASTQAEVIAAVNDAIKSSSVLSLSDTKGRELLVPYNKINYVEVGQSSERRVGFAAE